MNDHDDRHDQGYDMRERGRALKDNGVGQLDIACVAFGLDANAEAHIANVPNDGAQRYGRVLADLVEVAEAHGAGYK